MAGTSKVPGHVMAAGGRHTHAGVDPPPRLLDNIRMIEVMGWTGGVLFSCCAVPQCLKTWRTRRADDLSWMFLLMWFFGEILTFAYVVASNARTGDFQYPLLANYVFNFLLVCFLLWAKCHYAPRSGADAGRPVASA